jgi:hypothetical protein
VHRAGAQSAERGRKGWEGRGREGENGDRQRAVARRRLEIVEIGIVVADGRVGLEGEAEGCSRRTEVGRVERGWRDRLRSVWAAAAAAAAVGGFVADCWSKLEERGELMVCIRL